MNQLLFKIGLCAICLLGSVANPATLTAQILVILKDQPVEVAKTSVCLGDIARVSSIDPELAPKVKKIELAVITPGQSTVKISRQQVLTRAAIEGHRLESSDIFGAQEVLVVRKQNVTGRDSRSQIEAMIRQLISNQFDVPEADLHVALTGNLKLAPGIDRLDSIRFQPVDRAEPPLGRYTFQGSVENRDGDYASVSLTANISIYRELAMAKRDIPTGSRVTEEDIQVVRRPVMDLSSRFITARLALGKTVTKDIRMYSLVQPSDVRMVRPEDEVIIKRNSLVTALVQQNGLTVKLHNVKALSDGRRGEAIQLQNPYTPQLRMSARVIDQRTVEIY